MTNSSGFGQTEEERVKTANNLARTNNRLETSAAAQEYLTGITDRTGGTGSLTSETDDLKTTYLPDQSFGDQALLQELTNKQNMLNMEVAAELDRVNTEFFTDLDIRKAQAIAGETRAGQRVTGEETRAGYAEQGAQQRATGRVMYLYAITGEGKLVKVGQKNMRTKTGDLGKYDTVVVYHDEMQECIEKGV